MSICLIFFASSSSNVMRTSASVVETVGFTVEEKHFILRLWANKSMEQNSCSRCFLVEDKVLMGWRQWSTKSVWDLQLCWSLVVRQRMVDHYADVGQYCFYCSVSIITVFSLNVFINGKSCFCNITLTDVITFVVIIVIIIFYLYD